MSAFAQWLRSVRANQQSLGIVVGDDFHRNLVAFLTADAARRTSGVLYERRIAKIRARARRKGRAA